MHRCQSDSSLLIMQRQPRGFEKCHPSQSQTFSMSQDPFPCAFDPMDSNTWDNLETQDSQEFYCPDAQPLPLGAKGPNPFPFPTTESDSESETYSEYPEPEVRTDPSENTVHLSDLKNLRNVLGTLSNYNGGQLGQHLKDYRGLLIMPLHAVSIMRIPHGRHVGNPPILIYFPRKPLDRYPHLENFNESIGMVYPN